MSDFTHAFWPIFIAVVTLASIFGTWIFLRSQTTRKLAPGEKPELMEHTWDEDLRDLNNPLPRWWLGLFYATLIFSLVYLLLWPGLGSFPGLMGWTSQGQYEAEVKAAEAKFQPVYAGFMKQDIATVAADPEAQAIGRNLYLTYCMQCHGSDAGGAKGFPNLADNEWQWGGDPESIRVSIVEGRIGVMPALGDALGADGTQAVTHYVLALAGREHDTQQAELGRPKFEQLCAACHMPDGSGMAALGAPSLTDKVWLYGGSEAAIIESIAKGREGVMPGAAGTLGTTANREAKLHLLTAYIYGLSKQK